MTYSNDFRLMAVKLYFHFEETPNCNIYILLQLLNIAKINFIFVDFNI